VSVYQNDYILIVEPDHEQLHLMTAYFAEHEQFKFYTARTGSETLKTALKHRPKLILMEIQLPDKSGLSVLRELQSYPRTAHIPVLYLGGGIQMVLQSQALAAGAYDFIQKPLDVAEIAPRVRNALRRVNQVGVVHPETRLPTAEQLQQSLGTWGGKPHFRLDLRLAHYQAFKEVYGFINAREVMLFLGNIISDAVAERGQAEDLIGHVGEVEFVIITSPDSAGPIREQIQARLLPQLPQFYSYVDQEAGCLRAEDDQEYPLMTLELTEQFFPA
jgi:CheY-like chemotaxis protein